MYRIVMGNVIRDICNTVRYSFFLSLFCVQLYAFGDFRTELPKGYYVFSPYSGCVQIYQGGAPNSIIASNDIVPPNIVKIGMENNIVFGFIEEPDDWAKKSYYSYHPGIIHQGYFVLNIQNHNVILDLDEETWLNQLKLYGITIPQLQWPEHFKRFIPNFTAYLVIFCAVYWSFKIYSKYNSSKEQKISDMDRIDWSFIGSIIFKLITASIFVILILGASYELLLPCLTVTDESEKSIEERMIVHPSHFHCVYLDNISKILPDTKMGMPISNHPFFVNESFAVLQKYEEFDIWKVKYTRLGREYVFLYTPIPAAPEQEIITACDFGIWDTELDCYSPNILPFEKGKDITIKWSYLVSSGDISTIEGMPPFPGCVVKDIDGEKKLFYPAKLLSLIEDVYPNIEIPQSQVIDTPLAQ